MTFTGIDLHRAFSHLASASENGTIINDAKIKNSDEKILGYFANIPGPHKAVVECTIGWYWLVDLLHNNGIEIVLANSRMTKAIAAAKVKTDKVDATILAQLLRMDFIPPAYQLDPTRRAHRDVMRFRLRLVQKRISAVNSVYRLIEKFNLHEPENLPGSYYYQYQQLQAHIDLLDEHISSIEAGMAQTVLQSPEVQRIIRIPGIGEIDAYSIVLETADIKRFPTENNYFSYARLVPGASNSGGKTRHNYKYSKAGNKYLKIAFTDAAVHAVRYYPEIRDFYKRKMRKKGKRLTQNLVAKELARIVYHVLSTETDYNNTFKGKQLSHIKRHRWPRPTSPRQQLVF